MSKISLEVDLEKLSPKGQEALKVLLDDLAKKSGPGTPSDTMTHMADKLYARMARHTSMKGTLDALLDKGHLTHQELCDVSGTGGGAKLAGVLSSLTRNWNKYGGHGRFLEWNENDPTTRGYRLNDAGMLEPLRAARKRFASANK